MHGVAYDALLIPVLGAGDEFEGTGSAFAIMDAIERGAKVINASFGIWTYPDELGESSDGTRFSYHPQPIQTILLSEPDGLVGISQDAYALRYAADEDVVIVAAASNDYERHPIAALNAGGYGMLPYIRPEHHDTGVYQIVEESALLQALEVSDNPRHIVAMDTRDERLRKFDFSDLEGTLITAVAVGRDTRIASYSNRCGVAWRWCVAAPGGDAPVPGQSWESSGIYTTDVKGGYLAKGIGGTSYAAPMVAGAAAVMRQAFPYMTARQIIEVMLTSADRGGHFSDRDIYGRGMLDLGRSVKGPVEFGAEGFKPIFDVDTKGYDSWWRNDISGTGGLTKRGAGLLLMTGNNTYTGPTTVKGGILAVYGSNAQSALTIEQDAMLTGTGTVGRTEISGTVAPGNPGVALRVAGDYVQRGQGVYVAGISADGTASDRIHVQGGARIENAPLRIGGINANAVGREYTVLQAHGGIQGGYAKVADPYLFLDLEQGLRQNDATRYRFAVRRNDTPFALAAHTSNQRAAARALDTAGIGVAPYDATVMETQSYGLARRFDHWSGEAHASTISALSMQSGQLRDGVLARARAMDSRGNRAGNGNISGSSAGLGLGSGSGNGNGNGGAASAQLQSVAQDGTGKAAWAQYIGARDRLSGNGNAAGVDATSSGLMFGADMPLPGSTRDGTRVGLMAAFTNGNVKINDRGSASKVDSYTLGAYGSAQLDSAVRLRYGTSYTWHSVSARRDTASLEMAEGRYKAGTAQVFTEAGLPYAFGRTTLEPYAGLAYVDTRRRAFDESGNAGLHADAAKQQLGYSTLGLRGDTSWDLQDGSLLALHGGAGWRHAYGNITPVARMRFSEGDGFDVSGTPLARDAMLLEAGASVQSDRGMRISLGYAGQLARSVQSHAIKANAIWMF
jgi:subtilase-type serine protease